MKTGGIRILNFVLLALSLNAEVYGQELISRKVEDLTSLQINEERPVLVFLTADWCTYCERIKQTSFKNREIINLLNNNFYYVEFDIEERESVRIGKQKFVFVPSGVDAGIHQFAEAVGMVDGAVSTPTFVVLSSSWEILYQYNGYMNTNQIKKFLIRLLAHNDQ